MSLSHLAPFVDVSRQKIRKEVIKEFEEIGMWVESGGNIPPFENPDINTVTEMRLKKEIERGVQTIQYQINTLNTSNGLQDGVGRCKIA